MMRKTNIETINVVENTSLGIILVLVATVPYNTVMSVGKTDADGRPSWRSMPLQLTVLLTKSQLHIEHPSRVHDDGMPVSSCFATAGFAPTR